MASNGILGCCTEDNKMYYIEMFKNVDHVMLKLVSCFKIFLVYLDKLKCLTVQLTE